MRQTTAARFLVVLVATGCAHGKHAARGAPAQLLASPVQIPETLEDGEVHLRGALFWYETPRPASGRPVVVFSHGSPMTVAARNQMTPFGYLTAIHWFAARGYVVLAALRHGFGTSEGRFSEGVPDVHPDYARAGRIAAHDIRAILDYLKILPGLDLDRVILAGHSAGGFGSLAVAAEDGVRARALLNFAGGKGAQWLHLGAPYTDGIVAAAGEYGRTARVPSLWIYADNDRWFAPALVARMLDAYKQAGAPAELERVPAVGSDGHALFTREAERLWTGAAERFLEKLGLPATVIVKTARGPSKH